MARTLTSSETDDIERTRTLYTWVRDSITHSVDGGHKDLMWNATDVLTAGHGLCFGKSHLFVALCRALGIPAGLCYQRVRREDGSWVLHGLAAVYLEQLDKWIRLDPRGNKPGVSADFSLDMEKIAYEPSYDGEWLDQHVYPEPWQEITHLIDLSPGVSEFIENSGSIRFPPVNQVRMQGISICST
ncbi:transglutaminase-like domain-containing protein [Methanospirillum hungatei]|uniref:transglutaminase-like domain-containing protein n=1 Tax=Methanospirillum hungatei TaxID=2203 RepID=UPI002B953096|nr:transglutaminase-like domain-containing protein [Methanospirillum hungatei]HOW04979.1 transglutaminase-like domain-containing protein [Methanospirillum hungatei]